MGYLSFTELLYLLFVGGLPRFKHHPSHYLFNKTLVGHSNHLNVGNLWVGVKKFLYLTRVNVLAASNYHILQPAGNTVVAFSVYSGQVSGMKPTILIYSCRAGFRQVIISLHHHEATCKQFTLLPHKNVFPCFRINQPDLNVGYNSAHGTNPALQSIFSSSQSNNWRGLGLPITNGYLSSSHLVHDLPHDFNRTR